jgi:hypothetical protein
MDMDMDIPPIHYTAPLPSSAIQRTLNDVALFFIGTLTGTVLGRFMLYIENKYHLTSPESIFILGMLQLVLYSLALQLTLHSRNWECLDLVSLLHQLWLLNVRTISGNFHFKNIVF